MSEQMCDIRISVDKSTPDISIDIESKVPKIEFDISGTGTSVPEYDGPYHAESRLNGQVVLPTKAKVMKDDVIIDELPVYMVTNPAGGYTYFIGR